MMSLITLEQYLKIHYHDTINTLSAANFYISENTPNNLKKAQDYLHHQMLMESALKLLSKPENIDCHGYNILDHVNIALTRVDGQTISKIETNVDIPDSLEIKTQSSLFYRYIFSIISNSKAFGSYNTALGLPQPKVDIYSEESSKEVSLYISDNACGMKPEILSRITNYGFSSKGTSGLGLAFLDVVAPMINMRYDIQSEFHKGTTFKLSFNKE